MAALPFLWSMECTLEQAAVKEVEVSQRATVSQYMKPLSALFHLAP